MRSEAVIFVVIPALDEEASLPRVLAAIPDWVDAVYVADNGSADRTAEAAVKGGARVVAARRRGYGSACLAALEVIGSEADGPGMRGASNLPDIVVFLDADYSDHPEQMDRLVDPILAGDAELVIGSRVMGDRQRGALTPQQRIGNALACRLMRWFWKVRHTDLGPFRAIDYTALGRLAMDDPDFGWTVQMQVRAAKRGVKAIDVPVDYRKRIGRSKISGTIRGVLSAGSKILRVIFREAWGSQGGVEKLDIGGVEKVGPAEAGPVGGELKNRPRVLDRS